MKDALIQRFGAHRVSEVPVEPGEMPLLLLDLEARTPVTVLVTNGLREYKMPVPETEAGLEYNELYFCLPTYWEWEDRDNPQMNWIFHWIQRLAKYVQENTTWFGHGHTMPCGKEMKPLSATMKQNNFLLMNPVFLEAELAPLMVEGKEVHFLAIVPIFESELSYKLGQGTRKFIDKFIRSSHSEKLDDFRLPTKTSRLSFLRRG